MVAFTVSRYLEVLGDQPHQRADIYHLLMREVEPALYRSVMAYTNNNRSRAAKLLGITRSTLSRKLKRYRID